MGITDMFKLMNQAKQLKKDFLEKKRILDSKVFENYMKKDKIKIKILGNFQLVMLDINEEVFKKNDKQNIENLIIKTINEIISIIKKETKDEMKGITGGMDIPNIF